MSLYVRNVPKDLDEVNLKSIFIGCTHAIILRARKNVTLMTPVGTEDAVRQLFDTYPSFQLQSIFVEPVLHDGCVVAYVQLTDEQEMRTAVDDITNRETSLGSGKLRLTIQEQRQTKRTTKRNEMKQDEFRIKLYRLPTHVDERFLIRELNQIDISDSMAYVTVFREKLPANYFTDRSRIMAEDYNKALINLKSLFSSRNQFRSEPNIEIRSPTEDGRVVAFIRFNDPREIISAIDMCDSLDDLTIRNLGLNQLYFLPIATHRIVLQETLAQVINNKIEQTINTIKDHPNFPNINLFKKPFMIDDKAYILISIRGTNIQQLYKARMLFDDLLKGLPFQLYNHSWVSSVLFSNN
jgi:RNA recognition motif-containing protein